MSRVGLLLVGGVVAVLLVSLVLGLRRGAGAGPGELAGVDVARERVRVEVLNATGIPGLARAATRRLRDRGFDVVYFGNGRGFGADSSLVLDRVGSPEAASAVADALGLERVRSRPDTALYLDVTVVLGRDWEGARPAGSDSAAPDSGG